MDSLPQPPSPRRRWPRRALFVVVLCELVYIIAFEWAVRTGHLEKWINRRPEKILISFASAHSLVPFLVSVSGFELHGQTPKMRWRVGVDRATGWISPLGLFRRTLRIPWVAATGGEFWLRREDENLSGIAKSDSPEEPAERLPALAALPPLPLPRPLTTKPKWSFELPRIAVSGFREVWLDGLRLVGEIDARGGFDIYSGRELEVTPGRVSFESLRATIGETEIGRALGGVIDGRIARYPFKEQRGRATLQFISGQTDLRGELADGELLGLFLSRAPWITFGPTLGDLDARLVVENGDLLPGTHVEFRHRQLATKVFDFHARGDARVHFEVQPGAVAGAEEGAVLTVLYDDFEVRSGDEARPLFLGSGLSLVATTSELELGSVLDSTRLKIDLGTARLPDLAGFNSWLPVSSGLSLTRGDGVLTGNLDADLAANRAQGEFRATIGDAAVRYRDLDLMGGVTVEIHIPDANLERRTFELAGTRLGLTDFRVRQVAAAEPPAAAGWWAHFTLDEGRLTLPPASSVGARFTVNLRDSVPLVGLFETRKNLPKWVANLLTVEDIQAGGNLAWSPAETTLDDLATEFRGAAIQGRIRFGHELRKGLLMVEWRHLALGLRIDEAKKDWKFTGVRAWYEGETLRWAPRAGKRAEPVRGRSAP